LPPVDWQLVPIRAANVKAALGLAMRRINEAYARRTAFVTRNIDH